MVQHGLVPDEAAPQEPLAGGYVSAVVRVADTVRRNPGPNADFVRRLLGLTAGTALARESEVVCHNDLSPRNTVYRDHGSFPPQAKPRIGWTGPADNRPDPRWSRPTCPSTGCEPPPGSRPHR